MPITTREARQLSTTAEWTLVESSLPAFIKALSPARLKAKIARARKLRDKYVGLAKRQHRKAQPARRGTPGEALNARTARKMELFAQVLARFEERLARLASAERKAPAAGKRPAAPKKASATRAATRATTVPSPPAKVKASRAPLVPKSAVATRSGQHRVHAHLSSRGRRRQGRRDSR